MKKLMSARNEMEKQDLPPLSQILVLSENLITKRKIICMYMYIHEFVYVHIICILVAERKEIPCQCEIRLSPP